MTDAPTTIDMAHALANLSDDESIEGWVAELEPALVPLAFWLAEDWERRAKAIRRMASSRMVGEGLLSSGEVWRSPDGEDYHWSGDRHREVSDPEMLQTELHAVSDLPTLAKVALRNAFKPQPPKVYLTELDKVARFGGKEVEQTIRSFTKWVEGAPKLRRVGE